MSSSHCTDSSASTPLRVSWEPICIHGLPTEIRTSDDAENRGRRYFTCQNRKWDDCDFFQWIDEPRATTYCKNYCARRLAAVEDRYQRLLQSKAVDEIMQLEELKLKTKECELLKLKVEKLETWILVAFVVCCVLVMGLFR